MWWTFWARHHLRSSWPAELGISSSSAATVASTEQVVTNTKNWFTSLFVTAPAHVDPRQRAIAQLEASGMAITGEAFVRAVGTQHRPLIDLFLQSGIDVNAAGEGGRTALLVAALSKDWSLVEHLLASGADANRTTWS